MYTYNVLITVPLSGDDPLNFKQVHGTLLVDKAIVVEGDSGVATWTVGGGTWNDSLNWDDAGTWVDS